MNRRIAGIVLHVALLTCTVIAANAQTFITRAGDRLMTGPEFFYFIGANAYSLQSSAARGDTSSIPRLFQTAQDLGLSVIRTWGFFDSSDSLDPAVIQYLPGRYNERGLQGLDYVLLQAKLHQVRLLIPLVNSWDDFGGMNQYVRWKTELSHPPAKEQREKYTAADQASFNRGADGRSYRVALSPLAGHDDFYTDSVIARWYGEYLTMILQRINTFTGVRYRDDPAIMGWELANEPRSSDRTGGIVTRWVSVNARIVKSIDPNHLLGTGEEGFEISATGYSPGPYENQSWLFDGSAGIGFYGNSAIASIDFAGIHLYPEPWGLPNNAGNAWIRDHLAIAEALHKPLIVGEFGVRALQRSTYDSWLSTIVLDGPAGGIVWQLLDEKASDVEGYGIHCPDVDSVCAMFRAYADQFREKSQTGEVSPPATLAIQQNYPNPCSTQTTIRYTLPVGASVVLDLFNSIGERVLRLVDGYRSAGVRKELLDARALPSGAYFYRLIATGAGTAGTPDFSRTGKLLIVR